MLVKRLGAFFLDILEVVVFAVAIFLFIYLLLVQPHKIKGASMEPNFPDGQYLLTDKVSYRFHEPERGDVIVFEAPVQNGDEFIKRIIALPGETMMIKENKVYINSRILKENYLPEGIEMPPAMFLKEGGEVKVTEDNYIVLGDNRPFSSDSRAWGFVPKSNITGKAWFIYWPLGDVGTLPKVTYYNQ